MHRSTVDFTLFSEDNIESKSLKTLRNLQTEKCWGGESIQSYLRYDTDGGLNHNIKYNLKKYDFFIVLCVFMIKLWI